MKVQALSLQMGVFFTPTGMKKKVVVVVVADCFSLLVAGCWLFFVGCWRVACCLLLVAVAVVVVVVVVVVVNFP